MARRRWFQYTTHSLLLAVFVTAVVVAVLRPTDVRVSATLLRLHSVPDQNSGATADIAIVRMENVGRDSVRVSGMSFVQVMKFGVSETWTEGWSYSRLEMTLLRPGETTELWIPVKVDETGLCVGQLIAAGHFAEAQTYWSTRLDYSRNGRPGAIMQAGKPNDVDLGEFWRQLRRTRKQ